MILRIYLHKKLYIATLLDEEGGFITSSGHYSRSDLYPFITRCKKTYSDEQISIEWLGELEKRLPPIKKISRRTVNEK